jgi:hypothetical protein
MADDLFTRAAEIVSAAGFGSNALIRDGLTLPYWRARDLIAELQKAGILGEELDEEARLELLRPCGFY